jgi:aminoglycoside 3-N-acetyltransferase I
MSFAVRRLGPADAETMRELNSLFAAAFDDPASYESAPPDEAYLGRVLGDRKTIVLVVQEDEHIVGGLVAYVLDKLEKERSEIYIYDLAVAEDRRRQGIATALIEHVQAFAADLGAWVIYVQADHGDDAAIALYGKLGTREDVMHFDIPPRATR